jgi:signal recognition particle GTPase
MVLAELGSKLSAALGAMSRSVTIDEKVVDELVHSLTSHLLSDTNLLMIPMNRSMRLVKRY